GLVIPDRPWGRFWLLVFPIGILAAATNDRSILYVVAANVAVVLLLGRRALGAHRGAVVALAGISALLLLAFSLYMTRVHTSNLNTIPGFAGRIGDLITLLSSQTPFRFEQTYAELSLKLLFLNVVLFGIWAFWRWKLLMIALAALLPNIMTSIGGAEKIQFGF